MVTLPVSMLENLLLTLLILLWCDVGRLHGVRYLLMATKCVVPRFYVLCHRSAGFYGLISDIGSSCYDIVPSVPCVILCYHHMRSATLGMVVDGVRPALVSLYQVSFFNKICLQAGRTPMAGVDLLRVLFQDSRVSVVRL